MHSAVWDLMKVALPTVLTMTSFTMMQFWDKLTVSRIGAEPIYVGAQGNGGLVSFVPIAIAMGFLTVINTFVAQNLGAGKPDRAPAYAWAGLWISVAYWLAVLVPLGFAVPYLFEFMRQQEGLTGDALALAIRRDTMSVEYARILLFGGFATLCARSVGQYFYGMHSAMLVLIATLAGNAVDLFLNSLFIYGPTTPAWHDTGLDQAMRALNSVTRPVAETLGMKPMGIAGAAYSTFIGTFIEFLIPLAFFLSPKWNRRYRTRSSWRPSFACFRDLGKLGWPGALMFGNEMICWAFFMVYLVGKYGPQHSTAGWIAHQWMTLSFMPTVGVSVAITSTVGKCLGAKRPDLAAHRAWTGMSIALVYMGICGVLFLVLGKQMVGVFLDRNITPEDEALIVSLGSKFLIATAAFQIFDAVAMTLSHALRGAGDTVWPGIVTLVVAWTVLVGGGLAMVRFAPQLESVGPWIAAATYIVILAVVFLLRWCSGKWKTINLLDHSAQVTAAH